MPPTRRQTFPRTHRLGGRGSFTPIFDAGVRESRGPLTIYARPNDLAHPRLGISIGRKAGNAVQRNRIKRLLRESLRLMQHDLPRGYDLVIVVRPHVPLILAEYQRVLMAVVLSLHRKWCAREDETPAEPSGSRDPAQGEPRPPSE
ncbi:MAG: ribonuclease P protein component [Tepidisphaeraceae bacterium]